MSLNDIDDFAVEVTLNADDYNKALEELQAKNKELEQSLGKLESSFEQSGKSTKLSGAEARKSAGEMDKYMLSIRSVALGLASIGGATMAVKGLTDLTASTAKSNREMSINAKTLGMSVNQYRNWGRAITEMGGDADSFSQSMINMRDKITEFQVTGNPEILKVFNATEIAMLKNINTAESMENIFLNISDVIKKISESGGDGYNKSQFLAEQFGIDKTNHAMVLLKGKDAIKAVIEEQKKLFQSTEEQRKDLEKINDNINKQKNMWESITTHIGSELSPAMLIVQERTGKMLEYFTSGDGVESIKFITQEIITLAETIDAMLDNIISKSEKFYGKNIEGFLDYVEANKKAQKDLLGGFKVHGSIEEAEKAMSENSLLAPLNALANKRRNKNTAKEVSENKSDDGVVSQAWDEFKANMRRGSRDIEEEEEEEEDGISYIRPTLLTDAIFKGLEKFEQAYGNKSLDGLAKLIDSKQNTFETKLEDKERSAVEGAKMTDYSRAYGVPDNKKDAVGNAMKFFINNGYTSEQAAGIVGNLIAESNLNTGAEGDKGLKGGSSFGIAQWREGRLRQFEKLYGKHVKDASYHEQLQFILWELQNTHQSANRDILNSTTVEGASSAFTKKFEIPANKDQVALNRHSISRGVLRDHNDRQFQEINNSVQVMVGDVIIQTSSGTMKGAGVELGNSLANTWSNLNQLGASQR